MIPGATVMLAGIIIEAPSSKVPDGGELAFEAVQHVSASRPSFRVLYNIACFWSGAHARQLPAVEGRPHLERSLDALRQCLEATPPQTQPVLANGAREDPSLEPLRTNPATRHEFDGLTRPSVQSPGHSVG
jgi:hypothetical protein